MQTIIVAYANNLAKGVAVAAHTNTYKPQMGCNRDIMWHNFK